VLALRVMASFGDNAPDQLGAALPLVIPVVSGCVVDLQAEVCSAASLALTAVCDVVGNKDIEHLTGSILRSITHPEETDELMHRLAGVTFVQSVESPALAMVTPLLIKGLNSQKYATVRQSALIIDNMSRLVDDPIDAAPFMPFLMPVLRKATQIMSDPEARVVLERSLKQLNTLNVDVLEALTRQQHIELKRVLNAIETKMNPPKNAAGFTNLMIVFLNHVAQLCCSLMQIHKFGKPAWKEIEAKLALIDSAKAAACIDALRVECQAMTKPLPRKDEELEDPALELCNTTFTLAYGTKILLHNSKMKLLRGAKYGLLGGNDSGILLFL
jgi:elongation factor 3